MNKRVFLALLIVALVAAGVGAAFWWRPWQSAEPEREVVLYGNIDIREVQLAINDKERIAVLKVEEGDAVEEGQLLAHLQLDRFQLEVDRAKAQVATQQQVVNRLVAGTRPEEIRKARADLESAKATSRDAVLEYRRIEQLAKTEAASQQELDNARAAAESAEAAVNAAQATLDLALAGPRKEDIAEAKAQLKRDEADLALARHNLQDAYLYAPSNGVIEDRLLEIGDMASPTKPIFTMALTDPVWVRAYLPEPQLGKIRQGMKAFVTTDTFPGKKYEGWVGFISPSAEFTPKPVENQEVRTKLVYETRVFVHNPRGELRLGMPATVHIPLDQSSSAKERGESS